MSPPQLILLLILLLIEYSIQCKPERNSALSSLALSKKECPHPTFIRKHVCRNCKDWKDVEKQALIVRNI